MQNPCHVSETRGKDLLNPVRQYSEYYAMDCVCRKYLHFFRQNRNRYNKSLTHNIFREVTKMLINPVQ